VNKDLIQLVVWGVIVLVAFIYAWRKGHLMRLSDYVAETREELRKCTWPSVEELKGSTFVVLLTVVLLALFVIGSDFVILKFVRGVLPKL
jgi:preprotein translocase subunit SecE